MSRIDNFWKQVLGTAVFALGLTPISVWAQEVAEAVAVPVEAQKSSKSAGTPMERVNPKVRPLNVTIDLSNASTIQGTLVEVDVLLIKTAFGEASVPLAEIAGIRFPQGDDVSTSVVMLNGDSITGATDVKLVTVDTDWGQAKINGSSIRSILLIPNLAWTSSSGISGKRWMLQEAKAEASTMQNVVAGGNQRTQPNSGSQVIPASGVSNSPNFIPSQGNGPVINRSPGGVIFPNSP